MNNKEEKTEKELTVAKIDNGIVIDHITPPGRAFYALKALNIDENFPHSVFVAINLPSRKFGRKDLLKIRNMNREDLNIEKLGLLISGSNIAYIKDFIIIEKEKIKTPEKISGVIKCPGLNCITSQHEDVEPEFIVLSKHKPISLRCVYCDVVFNVHEHISLML
ncbi:MAG: aspartate carbamoyltransferase regulatory subunit [Candidatus Hodarchaeales archaeon]